MSPKLLIVIVVAAVLVGMTLLNRMGRTSGSEARALVAKGALLLDVRSATEFGSGHLEGALNVPVDQLERRIAELGAKDRPVVVYCASGMRSRFAASALKKAGFAAVHDIGPMSAW